MKKVLSEFFILSNRFSNGASAAGFSGLDAALLAAPAQLHHAALSEAAIRDTSCNRSINNRACTWS